MGVKFFLLPGSPDFTDLPWEVSLDCWSGICTRLEQVERGVSRHPVQFVNYSGTLYALKEMALDLVEREFVMIQRLEFLRLPAVKAVGIVQVDRNGNRGGVLITRYLESSLPFRSLFLHSRLTRYRKHLLNAMAGLLVQLHMAGVYWGDCSLSNTLFRRDAGALQAYLVDAETAEDVGRRLPPGRRYDELEIMQENIYRDLCELDRGQEVDEGVSFCDAGEVVRRIYHSLWELVTREEVIRPDEHYRIQNRVRALNELGFSVGEISMEKMEDGDQLRLRVAVTDRNFHRDQLYDLTGIEAEEHQAQQIMNEIQQVKSDLSQANQRNTPLDAAGYYWMEHFYRPVIERLELAERINLSLPEAYCQVLEHKWFLSERRRHDVGHQTAVEDYLQTILRGETQ